MSAIEVSGNLKFAEIYPSLLRLTFKRVAPWILGLSLVLFIFNFVFFNSQNTSIIFDLLLPSLVPAAVSIPLLVLTTYIGAKKSVKLAQGGISYRFSENEVETASSIGKSYINWDGLDGIQETAHDFLLFFQKPRFFIVPKKWFDDDAQLIAFRQLTRAKLGEKAKLKAKDDERLLR